MKGGGKGGRVEVERVTIRAGNKKMPVCLEV